MNLNGYTLVFQQEEDYEFCLRNIPNNYHVYALVIGDDLYIGSSAHVISRIRQHMNEMMNGTHYNKYMTSAFLKSKKVLGYILDSADTKSEILRKEQFYIDKYQPYLNIGTAKSKKSKYVRSSNMRIVLPKKKSVAFPIDKENYIKMLLVKSQHRIGFRELSYAAVVSFLNKYFCNESLSQEGLDVIDNILSDTDINRF